ncbi:RING finger protein 222 [Microcaecilia unicolor]|uniref:RING finger protein 222 n=1 Tax=Microcaecilia unicolor TaxID=1415580 RepID=A0A6P7YG19_9AMPH|nr:RING finger protein 222 [Microcaecilia unicolor]
MPDEEDSKGSSLKECPVCYERLHSIGIAERKLKCGHVFCHDCLVKYLLTNNEEGPIKKSIVCPLCRYVTFLSKKGPSPNSAVKNDQTLEVPLSPTFPPAVGAGNILVIPNSGVLPSESIDTQLDIAVDHSFCSLDSAITQNNFVGGSQIFVISDQGTHTDNEETVSSATTQSRQRQRCRFPMLFLVLLILLFVAILCIVLPWVLLVKKDT